MVITPEPPLWFWMIIPIHFAMASGASGKKKKHAQVARAELQHQCKFPVKKVAGMGPCDKILAGGSLRDHMKRKHLDRINVKWHPAMIQQYFVAIEPESAVEERLHTLERGLRVVQDTMETVLQRLDDVLSAVEGVEPTRKRRHSDVDSDDQHDGDSVEEDREDMSGSGEEENGEDTDQSQHKASVADEESEGSEQAEEDADNDKGDMDLFGSPSEDERDKDQTPPAKQDPPPERRLVRRSHRMRAGNMPPPNSDDDN